MERRAAALAAFLVVLAMAGVASAAPDPAVETSAAVGWPVSTLLLSEVQTGGASASDEFAEITNVGAAPVDLVGLEIVYVTSTGSTITRKASWAVSTPLGSGQHLFIANTSGAYAGLADATYSGGFAATGGALVLRAIGGAPIDAVGWGDATNAFVEGAAIAAPAAGASVERKAGGLAGNTVDTNDNAADWFAQATPNPQSLSAPPVPAPAATPTPAPTATASPTPTPTGTPTGTPTPTATPIPTDSPSPTAEPTATPSVTVAPTDAPSPSATAEPTRTPLPTPEPTAAPTPTPTTVPTSSPTPVPVVSIAEARAMPDGASVLVEGVLTTQLGALEAGRKAFVQDATGGIAIYLDVAITDGPPAGSAVSAFGTLDERFAERTLRVGVGDITALDVTELPPALREQTGAIGEALEGVRVAVEGLTVGSSTDLSDGLGLMVDDGTGQVRVIVGAGALAGATVPAGTLVSVMGPVGQRDSTGTGLSGYRIHATVSGELAILPGPSPSPTPTPSSTPTATPLPTALPIESPAPSPTVLPTSAPTASPSPAPTSSPSPSPTPAPTLTVVEARGTQVGATVTVSGVVTAEGGRLGLPPLIAIADGTGGIVVRLPDGIPSPVRGSTVVVRGVLADPYGQLEIRPPASGFRVTGQGSLPAPVELTAGQLGEATEGRLAQLTGTVALAPKKGTSGDLAIDLTDPTGATFRVIADASSQVIPSDLVKGRTYELTGIVGQRASHKGALDGYRLFVRDRSDVVAAPAIANGASAGGSASVTSILMALALGDGASVMVEGSVTAGAALLDSSGRRIVIQDATGAIEVFLPPGAPAPAAGTRVRVGGITGHAWGAPRIAASAVEAIGQASVAPTTLDRPPGERDEWLLVRLSGTVRKVERLGDRWRAEVVLPDGTSAPVLGQAGAGIPSTAILVGRRVTVTGIVRRPYPTASDRRFAVLPRSGADLSIAPAGDGAPGDTLSSQAIGGTAGGQRGEADITPDTDLATLADHVGDRVRVGGLIVRVAADGFDLDDGTALAHVVLRDDMGALLPHLREGEAIAATGLVTLVDGAATVVVGSDGTLVRVGALGQALPIGAAGADGGSSPSGGTGGSLVAADSAGLGPAVPATSLIAMALISIMSVLVTVLRRRLVRRRLRTALVERLAGLRINGG